MSSYAYQLNILKRFELIEGQQEAIENHEFNNFKQLGNHVKKIIHGFPKSFQNNDFRIQDMEIYIGVALPDQLYKRFTSHEESKNHEYGIILGTSSSEIANYLEKVGILLLKKLEENGNLCVKNCVARGHNYDNNDKVSNDELIFYYMTIKINSKSSSEWIKPNTEEREDIKSSMHSTLESLDLTRTDKNHINDVVDGVHLSTDHETVQWHSNHH